MWGVVLRVSGCPKRETLFGLSMNKLYLRKVEAARDETAGGRFCSHMMYCKNKGEM